METVQIHISIRSELLGINYNYLKVRTGLWFTIMTFPHLSVNGVCGGIMNIKLLPSLPVQSYQSEHVSPVPRTDIHNMNTELFLQGGGNHQKIFWQISLPWPDIALSYKSMKMVKICQSLSYLRQGMDIVEVMDLIWCLSSNSNLSFFTNNLDTESIFHVNSQ